MLSRDQILNAKDVKTKLITIPDWGECYIRVWDGDTRDRFETLVREKKMNNVHAWYAVHSLCDENGSLLFSEKDLNIIGKKSSKSLGFILMESAKFNSMTEEDLEEAKKN